MNRYFTSIVRHAGAWAMCAGATVAALDIDNTGNDIFDLYFFGNGEAGLFGTTTGISWMDEARQTSGRVKDSSTHYWNQELKQAMLNAVNTWTNAISTPYDTEKHARKLRIGFFLDDASTTGGVMDKSMAGYATAQTVTTNFDPAIGGKANIYSVAEWAWRDNQVTDYYKPDGIMEGAYWETNILANESNSIDMAIVLNPVITSYGFDAQGYYYYDQTDRTVQQMQNIATHEIGHGMGMDSRLYTQKYDASTGKSVAALSGLVSTWDRLVTLEGEHIVTVQDGEIYAQYETLNDLQAAGWECAPEKDPTLPESYTGNELQYDPDRRLSLEGEIGVHISAVMLEGNTLEHISHGDGLNVLGPGGTANATFSDSDLRTLELLGWDIHRNGISGQNILSVSIPEPASGALALLGLSGLALRRRRV